jgi:hypothetical protein
MEHSTSLLVFHRLMSFNIINKKTTKTSGISTSSRSSSINNLNAAVQSLIVNRQSIASMTANVY